MMNVWNLTLKVVPPVGTQAHTQTVS